MPELLPQHAAYFTARGVDPAYAAKLGVVSVETREEYAAIRDQFGKGWETYANLPAMFIPWTSPTGRTEIQVRPDKPTADLNGETAKFKFRNGMEPVLWAVRVVPGAARAIVCEGLGKALVAGIYAPADTSVYAIAGSWMWRKDSKPIPDLLALAGHEVTVSLDADAATNRDVFDAGMAFREALETFGVAKVSFIQLPAGGKVGLDDLLADLPEEARAGVLERLITSAKTRPAKGRPKGKGVKVPEGREALDVSNAADVSDWLLRKLGTGPLAGFFARDGEIVHTPAEGEDGYVKLSDEENERGVRDDDGPAQVRAVHHRQIAARVGFTYWCYTDSDGESGKSHAMFPASAAENVVAVPDLIPNVRRLRGVTHTPLVRRDGSILDTPGYDPATGLYFMPTGGLEVPPVPDKPTKKDLAAAVALVDEIVWDFPFRSYDHRANFVGLLLTPLMRELTPPPYKLGVFDAPQSRSGKTLMSKVARTLHGGVVRASVPADEAEWSKTLSTILNVTTAPVVTFDNVRGELTSGTFDGLLTEDTFNARQLGVTDKMIVRSNDRVWTITSNNAKLGGDLAKRALWISINANRTDPEARSGFKHPDLIDWIAGRRGDLLAALLTIVRAWVVAGRPAPSLPGTDIWRHWTGTVRAILEHAGMPGMFDRPDSKRQVVSDEDADWANFMAAAHRVFGDQPWTCRQLLDTVDKTVGLLEDTQAIHPDELPSKLGEKALMGLDVAKSLGRVLSFKTEAWQGGYVVREAGTTGRNKVKLYRVEIEDDQTPHPDRGEGQTPHENPGQIPDSGRSDNTPAGFAGFAGSVSGARGFKNHVFSSNGAKENMVLERQADRGNTPQSPQTPHARASEPAPPPAPDEDPAWLDGFE